MIINKIREEEQVRADVRDVVLFGWHKSDQG